MLTRQEFLKNPNYWFDQHPELVKDLKKLCYTYLQHDFDFYRRWFPNTQTLFFQQENSEITTQEIPDDTGPKLDLQYLRLSRLVVEQKWTP